MPYSALETVWGQDLLQATAACSLLSLIKAGFTQEEGSISVSCISAIAILLTHMLVDKPTCSVLITCARNTFFKVSTHLSSAFLAGRG